MHALLLAAGSGSRMGMPKALVRDQDGAAWVTTSVERLRQGGCQSVTVVVGAQAELARALVPQGALIVHARDWHLGMSASLRAGLEALEPTSATAVLVHLVDLPDVTPDVIRRLVDLGDDSAVLARAGYDGTPGHPVLLGRAHWAPLLARTRGDSGARDYLRTHLVTLVECGDLATGHDIDTPSRDTE
ncbi:nucleotidyltransferase family protein [Nocardioides cavernaquae]|uniref:Nucleotidyltransferase family protein n=1 Tax=Nocardioides cavernaquae TaxID=2321396 RepID=A0A3A5H7X0_9ACTN|nr:nucleotidyltransferase family protein [Nocardioides cavernaquae]RJS46756.1 nucleotidyltransferase family protein [Nocardioides cavernaquae]